jgi:hypothetical protein
VNLYGIPYGVEGQTFKITCFYNKWKIEGDEAEETNLSRIFGKKKEEKKQAVQIVEEPHKMSELEQLAGDDKTSYEALAQVMFLDPRKIEASMKQAVDNAKKAEKDGDIAKAGMWYEVAGGLAIYEGNVKKVVEYYGEAHRVIGRDYKILASPEKAVALAKEYYKQRLIT